MRNVDVKLSEDGSVATVSVDFESYSEALKFTEAVNAILKFKVFKDDVE